MNRLLLTSRLLIIFTILPGCYKILPSKGGGQISTNVEAYQTNPSDILLPEGYEIEVVTTGLTFPTDITFDEEGSAYVIESGYSYGEIFLRPALYKLNQNGQRTLITTGDKNGPWNGITYHAGNFYIAEGGQLDGGKILRVSPDGKITALVEELPSFGDHHTNGLEVKDGYVYFGQGTATNAGVVGNDNADYGWLQRNPGFHDTPCQDIRVNAQNFHTKNRLTDEFEDEVITGPYMPYGTSVQQDQVIKGTIPCSGAVMRVPIQGGNIELVAWGFRNPYGLATAPDGSIYLTENSYDVRGSRPVWGTGDLLWKLETDRWYGWPDFNGGIPINTFKVPGGKNPKPILSNPPGTPPKPVATFEVHASANGIDFSSSESFGFAGQAFVAELGDMAPVVGKVIAPVGFKVVRVNIETGVIEDFAVNKSKGPASRLKSGGLERPISVRFNPSGDALYIVDFGIIIMDEEHGAIPVKESGTIWKVTKK